MEINMFRTWLCVTGLALLFVGVQCKDYYDILHVHRSADEATIKRAYRKLALKMHPDKVQGSDEEKRKAAEKFAEVGHAYEVLTDPKKREIYDRYGEDGLKNMGQGGHGMAAEDIFSQFFGGAFNFGFGGPQEEQTPRGEDVRVQLEVTLKDVYVGKAFEVQRDKNVIKPAPGKRECNCKQRIVTKQIGLGMFQQTTKRECEKCDNVKFVREMDTLSVKVEPGMVHGQEIPFFEEGEPVIDGDPGDLIFVLSVGNHPIFTRQGSDLHMELTISLLDALVGFQKKIEHLDGHSVDVGRKGVTRPSQVVRIANEGMPIYDSAGKKGSLFVKYFIAFPEAISSSQEEDLKKIFAKTSFKGIHDEL